MAYKVLKKIKGNLYWYLQESFRVGSQVKSKCTYLGPALGGLGAGGTVVATTETRSTPQTTQDQENKLPLQDTGNPEQTKTQTTKRNKTFLQLAESKLKITINLEKHKISKLSLKKTLNTHLQYLSNIGIDPSTMPKIKLKYGGINSETSKHTKNLFDNGYRVSLPLLRSGQRTVFLTEYRKAVAKSGLDLIKEQNPCLLAELKSEFDQSYKRTNQLVGTYLMNTNDRDGAIKAFVLNYFGIYHAARNSTIDVQDVGLTDKKRTCWEDEYTDIMQDIIHRGYDVVHHEWSERLKHAHNIEKKAATTRYSRDEARKWYNHLQVGYMNKANKDLRRALARRQAQEEAMHKLELIGKCFNFNKYQN